MSPFVVSNAAAEDYPAFARLFPELEVVNPLPSLDSFAKVIAPDAIFAREGNALVGFGWSRPRGDQLYVVNVITDPAHRRRGVGRVLMQELARRGRAAGFRRWMLRVKPENLAARRLYEACGMQAGREGVQLRVAWADLTKLPNPPTSTTTAPIGASDDARFESALGLSRGEFSATRGMPGRIFMGAAEGDVPVACVAFDPAFPGAPLSASSPASARAVLQALVPHAVPPHDGLFVFLEDNPALESAFLDAGAHVTMRLIRMEGDLAEVGGFSAER